MHRLAASAVLIGGLCGCGNWSRVGSGPQPNADHTITQLVDLPSVYRRLGRLATGAPVPFVGSVSFAAGSQDSVLAIIALSLENRALVFQKEGRDFVARYRVEVTAQPSTGSPVQLGEDEVVRVGGFQETLRTEESILFQQVMRLTPGPYHFAVTVRDRGNATQSRAEGDFSAPAFASGSTSAPMVVYQVKGRADRNDALSLIVNPRGTVAYGGDTVLAYVEGYAMGGPRRIPFELRDDRDSVVLQDSLSFAGTQDVESAIIRFAPDSAPLGELKLSVGERDQQRSTSLLVSFSQAWLVTNFDEMVSLLRYFGEDERLSRLRKASPADRPRLWREFWVETDPNPITPENEALNEYFNRLAAANARFRDENTEGWRTDRGEVLIGLGDPDEVFDASPATQGRVIRWTYNDLRLNLYFQDESGFGRFRLTPGSRSEFERALSRVRRHSP